jgi:tungstate transport system ATP-binding protein
MSVAPAYTIRSLVHAYDEKISLEIPHLEIPAGEICGLTGPNGSGKTTLLSILALLRQPVSGSLYLQGIEVTRKRNAMLRRNLTLVHQKPILFSTTVRNNIAYGLRASGCSSKEIRRRTESIIEEAGLAAIADKQARKLSGGESQRVVLARALVLETPILLLDEPTSSLDKAFKPRLLELLHKSSQDRKTTIVLATHDADFASSIANRIIRLDDGRLHSS